MALQRFLGVKLLGRRSGRNHLPDAVQAAAPHGLPLLLVHAGTVIAAFRLTAYTATALTLIFDAALAADTVGVSVSLQPGMTVQIRRLHSPLLRRATPAAPRPRVPGNKPWGGTALYEWTRTAMDTPPTL